MKVESKGLIKSELIEDYISKRYNCTNVTASTIYSKGLVEYKFDMITNDKYSKVSTFTIDSNDLSSILIEMLREDEIEALSLSPEFEHIPGDCFEPLDYGTYKYIGFKFTYSSEK